MGEVLITPVRPEDWESHRDLRLAMLKDSPSAFATTYDAALRLTPEDWLERIGANDFFQAWCGGEPAGSVGLGDRYVEEPHDAMVFALWVVPAVRGSGVGTALVGAALDRARWLGKRRVILDVMDGNEAATRLYERLGFRPTGQTTPSPQDPGRCERRLALRL